ncbi:MAG: ankyrin repeat domain-containing protein [Elusimicrobiales bacterium]
MPIAAGWILAVAFPAAGTESAKTVKTAATDVRASDAYEKGRKLPSFGKLKSRRGSVSLPPKPRHCPACDKKLAEAVLAGDCQAAAQAITSGAKINSSDTVLWDNGGRTYAKLSSLMIAAVKGDAAMSRVLLSAGANAAMRDSYTGKTAAHYAAEYYAPDVLEELLTKRSANSRDGYGMTPLMYAVESARLKRGKGLFGVIPKAGAKPFRETAEMLLSKGADINARNNDGSTALTLAARNTAVMQDAVRFLSRPETVNYRNKSDFNRTVLMEALLDGGADGAMTLLESDEIHINARDKSGETPLMFAASLGHGSLSGRTPDFRAIETLIRKMAAKGADINARDRHGNTALCYAQACVTDEKSVKRSGVLSSVFGKTSVPERVVALLKSLGAKTPEEGCDYQYPTCRHLRARPLQWSGSQ